MHYILDMYLLHISPSNLSLTGLAVFKEIYNYVSYHYWEKLMLEKEHTYFA